MTLCHKCSGILASEPSEDTKGLSGCGCMSGWVRGFEPNLDRTSVIHRQITQCFERIELYTRQERTQDWIDDQYVRAEKLFDLL